MTNAVFANATLVYSEYEFLSEQSSYTGGVPDYIISYSSKMKEMTARYDVDGRVGDDLHLRGGLGFSHYGLSTGETLH